MRSLLRRPRRLLAAVAITSATAAAASITGAQSRAWAESAFVDFPAPRHAPSATATTTCAISDVPMTSQATISTTTTAFRQPAVFVPHGGGPLPLLGDPLSAEMVKWLTHFQQDFVTTKPDAIVLVTAHWEADVVSITSSAAPPLLYDYYGFPPEAYEVKYPAPGHPELAQRIHKLLESSGVPSRLDAKRGNDHGVFVPLKLMYPDADVPVVQVSVLQSLDPEAHIRLGEALRQLRRDNILLVGSGLSFHSFKYFFGDHKQGNRVSGPFHDYLNAALVETTDADERRRRLVRWLQDAPYAREVHPREEHLMPLLVMAGAGLEEPCEEIFRGKVSGLRTSGYLFGERS